MIINIIKTLKGIEEFTVNDKYIVEVRFCTMVMVACNLLTIALLKKI